MVFLIILAYLIIGFIEIVPLVKRNQRKELVLYSVMFGLAFVISILLSLGVKIPSPAKAIEKVVLTVLGK
ncbi:hypothetical protein [Tepidibacter formicigenes]|jgi:hypothetical protein|uniref:Uncharacterized protein n=1 Tax=Tepidibacter formicigenes DSM 15518 TaxID=1123349 RepID=A0A1M6KYM2_9FIRM|nr:hypothetical protein [Tepidibacter formicigenes]SHJ63952.1 hypothetical protein SAMN02744037_00492 [Tepidibacter formicigenes DSM 15518]